MRLLRVYPTAWRARYGDELANLIEELDGDAPISWRVRLDVVRAGLVERVRVLGLGALPPRERAREGALLVLYSWMLFVLGGFGVLKASEHWKAVTPAAKQGVPAAAFDVLFVAAGIGSALVLVGVAAFLPCLTVFIREGCWKEVRRPIIRAAVVSLVTAAVTFGLARWAHSLTPGARNGGDTAYSAAFIGWIILLAACLFGWAGAAAATARRLSLPASLLRLEVWLGAAVSAAMVVMTIATAVWWGSLARAAPWFFEGRPIGSSASALVSNIVIPVFVMLLATTLGLIGARQAMNALARTPAGPQTR